MVRVSLCGRVGLRVKEEDGVFLRAMSVRAVLKLMGAVQIGAPREAWKAREGGSANTSVNDVGYVSLGAVPSMKIVGNQANTGCASSYVGPSVLSTWESLVCWIFREERFPVGVGEEWGYLLAAFSFASLVPPVAACAATALVPGCGGASAWCFVAYPFKVLAFRLQPSRIRSLLTLPVTWNLVELLVLLGGRIGARRALRQTGRRGRGSRQRTNTLRRSQWSPPLCRCS